MLTDDLRAASAVFSWKCSVLGDYLFDVAWCTFWSAWHLGIAAIDLWLAPSLLRTADRLHPPRLARAFAARFLALNIDSHDPAELARFWLSVLGWEQGEVDDGVNPWGGALDVPIGVNMEPA